MLHLKRFIPFGLQSLWCIVVALLTLPVFRCRRNHCRQSGLQQSCRNASSCWHGLKQRAMNIDCRACVRTTCTATNVKKKLPILEWLPKYRCSHFQGDLIAGLTVGLTVIPQGLAYAQVAELPPQFGLYSAFMGCFVYCVFGTAKDITLGPTAIMSLMTAEFGHSPVHLDATVAIVLTFMTGIIQMCMGLFSLGFLLDFIPYPVINSFTVAAAITIAVGQIKQWLGLDVPQRDFLRQLYWTFAKIKETKIWDFVMGLVCMILLFSFKKLKQKKWRDNSELSTGMVVLKQFVWIFTTARNAVVVIVASGVAAGLLQHNIDVLSLTRKISGGIPSFKVPDFSINSHNVTMSGTQIMSYIGEGMAIVPLMGVVESLAIGNAFARKNRYKIDSNQELLAIGISNFLGSFVSSYPVTGSFSRTAVNSQSGVRTPFGGVWTGGLILLALGVLTPMFKYIPSAALAGVIIMAVLDMVSFSLVKKLWHIKRLDLVPWFTCFILSFLTGIEWGIVGGVCISMLLLLYPWARPRVKVVTGDHRSSGLNPQEDVTEREITVVQLGQGLLYPGIDYVRKKVLSVATQDAAPKSVVVDCKHLANIDYSTVQGFEGLTEDFILINSKLVLAEVQPQLMEVFGKANIDGLRIFGTVDEAVQTLLEEGEQEDNPRQSLIAKDQATASPAQPPSSTSPTNTVYGSSSTPLGSSPVNENQPGINHVAVDVEKSGSEEA